MNHRRAQSNNDVQKILCARVAGLVEEEYQPTSFDPRRINLAPTLFQIPEQNDLISSSEITQESSKQHSQLIKELNQSNKQNNQSEKENKNNISQCSSLINQIQQIVKFGHSNKDLMPKNQTIFNSDSTKKKSPSPNHLSFTKELQKHTTSSYLQYQQTISSKQNVTPDKKRELSNTAKITSQKARNDSTPTYQNNQETIKNNQFQISIFNNLLKQDSRKKPSLSETCDSNRKLEIKMKKIEQEIDQIKKRQDHLDETNKNIQEQLSDFIHESKQQRECGSLQLKKIEQLEQLTRRNEESISFLKQYLMSGQYQKKTNENNINYGNLQSHEITDFLHNQNIQKRFTEYNKQANHQIYC